MFCGGVATSKRCFRLPHDLNLKLPPNTDRKSEARKPLAGWQKGHRSPSLSCGGENSCAGIRSSGKVPGNSLLT
jgi:hypothetical protein